MSASRQTISNKAPRPQTHRSQEVSDRVRSLRTRLQAGENVVGAMVRMPCEDIVEMLGVAGLDFIVIDCEHGPADVLALRQHIALAQLHNLTTLVRTGEHEAGLVLRALDQGADGIVAPHVDTAEEASELVRSAHYPPTGTRGFATYSRVGRFGTVPADTHSHVAAENTLVIAMLESPRAAEAASEILQIEGIDGYLIGPADLRASTGINDRPAEESVARIHRLGTEAGSWRAEMAEDVEAARASFASGSRLVVYNLTHVLMQVFNDLDVTDR